MSGPVVKINKDLELDGALVLVCFPSVGMVSSIVAHYFIDNLDLKFVGGVVDERLPSICLVKDGAPMPAIRIYAGEPVCRVDDCDKLVIIMTELVIAPNLAHGIAEAMLEWSKASNAVMGVLIDAFAQGGGPAMNVNHRSWTTRTPMLSISLASVRLRRCVNGLRRWRSHSCNMGSSTV